MSTVKQTQTQPGVQQTPDQIQNIPNRRPMKKAAKAPVQKSASAFRTISEVADELRVEQHVLRFWETKFSQIKPLKRGGGRRYYRPEDVDMLKNIHHLLYQEGYTIKGVQKLLSATRGNLSARVGDLPAAVKKNKDELQSMLDELKSMRKLIAQE
jgi:DNA-binding transcriptional MerR regulator